ncbi:hypothetical protein GGTG_09391 [Gaeumannomyces tritici R3-111a-1]|uniref:Uncharacterized protein n=1 Tax=Gaeumannomyces tritici (strain R3-111a-1) TaxID=644352 RepID=J3P795_GAET3|nr:hypothetical protein GGTG_09391 [Gaeumannomyces tritici R3-111a-1]EJT72526.1 hypothetical protein GGTG_09391 [Gaeumannomyces tritici R3-111a-1]
MQFSKILAALTLNAAAVTAALSLTPDHETGLALTEACAALSAPLTAPEARDEGSALQKRRCAWRSCDDCYARLGSCVNCSKSGWDCAGCIAHCERTCC